MIFYMKVKNRQSSDGDRSQTRSGLVGGGVMVEGTDRGEAGESPTVCGDIQYLNLDGIARIFIYTKNY